MFTKIDSSKDFSYLLEIIREKMCKPIGEFCKYLSIGYNTYYKRQQFGEHHRGYQLDNALDICRKLDLNVVIMDDKLYKTFREWGYNEDERYDIGYNCGYADAMSDIAESEDKE